MEKVETAVRVGRGQGPHFSQKTREMGHPASKRLSRAGMGWRQGTVTFFGMLLSQHFTSNGHFPAPAVTVMTGLPGPE